MMMTDLPQYLAVTPIGYPPTIEMEDENFLEKTTSTDTEGDTTTMIIFQNNVQYNITK